MVNKDLDKIKRIIFNKIKEFYGSNLISVVFYGAHLKRPTDEIDVLVIIDKPYDPVKLNRIADFVEKIRDPVEKEYGIHLLFDLYTKEEAENFHVGYLDIARGYEIVYDKNNYFKNLIGEMTDPRKAIKYVQYLTTIEYVKLDDTLTIDSEKEANRK